MRKLSFRNFIRPMVTAAVGLVALVAAGSLWIHYERDPWTRDGRVRADVVEIAPDVPGLVTQVGVGYDQAVKRGDILFVIDRDRYRLTLQQADASVTAQRATLAEARREAARNRALGNLVSREVLEQSESRVDTAAAALQQALAARDVAALNLERTVVRAPVNGYLTDLTVRTGDYVSPGKPVLALIDAASFRVEGYFEETKLSRIRIGAPVKVHIMGEEKDLRGHIESIAHGIEDRERQPDGDLLPNVNPTFSWVRLAQRVPVRVAIDDRLGDVRLIAGRTATVTVLESRRKADTP